MIKVVRNHYLEFIAEHRELAISGFVAFERASSISVPVCPYTIVDNEHASPTFSPPNTIMDLAVTALLSGENKSATGPNCCPSGTNGSAAEMGWSATASELELAWRDGTVTSLPTFAGKYADPNGTAESIAREKTILYGRITKVSGLCAGSMHENKSANS
uniref:Uncharacterized protein n=1 Tax=Anopheles maculatus TaxID=74869 RepID=A0A182TAA2_9DIPT